MAKIFLILLENKLKISITTTMTDPESRKDPWREALQCYEDIADEVIITGQNWQYDFIWNEIGEFFQEGFDKANGDWVIRMDLDYFFHENDILKIRKFLELNSNEPVIAFPQYQIFTPDRYQVKTKLCIALNKKEFPQIKLNGGGDLCQPTLDNKQLIHSNAPFLNTPVYQYDSIFRTKEIIADDRARFARAWNSYFGNYGDRGGGTQEQAFEAWFEMIQNRFKYHVLKLEIENHPKYIQDRLKNIQPDEFGYDLFGLKNNLNRNIYHYLKGYKQKYF